MPIHISVAAAATGLSFSQWTDRLTPHFSCSQSDLLMHDALGSEESGNCVFHVCYSFLSDARTLSFGKFDSGGDTYIYMYIDDGWGEENRLSGIQIYERFYDCDSVCVIES